ncbi:p-hydroxybenzoic acid efflux pump subunit aaeB [Melia azedarach]|uniref:p-hydroxybenzoic acid efflux pump subunit aaeB n=1 Tax=Melia azedarach TaxID=155640 RepID=A0ACC1X0P4_MELAZ|nr:p-hydroxybenzoic acid efflux pump subunit aaeB [Melia azedarach]
MLWERPQMRFLKPNCMDPREKLQELEIPIRGMELAMTSGPSFPVIVIDEEFKDVLNSPKAEIGLKLEQAKCFATLKAPGKRMDIGQDWQLPLVLKKKTSNIHSYECSSTGNSHGIGLWNHMLLMFQKFENFRFLALLPWIVFTTFLRHSRMYGDPGRISAVIGALLILGRKNYGRPSEFGIARITEATTGLMCFVIVEILFQPARAATLAKTQLGQSLEALRDAIEDIVLFVYQKNMPTSTVLRDKQKKLTSHINKLQKFTVEAKLEPNFLFLPFYGACYEKLMGSLSRMADLLLFVAYKTEFLSQISEKFGVAWNEIQEQITDDLKHFREKVGYYLKCLEKMS